MYIPHPQGGGESLLTPCVGAIVTSLKRIQNRNEGKE